MRSADVPSLRSGTSDRTKVQVPVGRRSNCWRDPTCSIIPPSPRTRPKEHRCSPFAIRSGDGPNALGTVVTVPIRDASCLSLLVSPTGITVWAVTATPDWTFNVKRDEPDQIDVLWTNVANPALTHEYRRSQNSVRVS
jgi:hypothetical protein